MTDLADDYTTWDAPYVLGSLTRTERREYEEHLAGCPTCQAAVADLAGMPGMLGMVDRDTALAMLEPRLPFGAEPGAVAAEPGSFESASAPPVPQLLPRLADAAERRRKRTRWVSVGSAVLAAAAAVAIAVPVVSSITEGRNSPGVAEVFAQRQMDPLVPTPVQASFKLLGVNGKTTVEMSCSYASGGPDYSWGFEMWMTLKDGTSAELVGWTAGPGDALTLTRTTEVAPEQIQSVEIRSLKTNQPVLRGTV